MRLDKFRPRQRNELIDTRLELSGNLPKGHFDLRTLRSEQAFNLVQASGKVCIDYRGKPQLAMHALTLTQKITSTKKICRHFRIAIAAAQPTGDPSTLGVASESKITIPKNTNGTTVQPTLRPDIRQTLRHMELPAKAKLLAQRN